MHPKSNIDSSVVNGLLARYYLLTGKWEQAVTAARAAQLGYNITEQSNYRDGFMNISNSEWMWGFMHNEQTTSIYASFFSHISNLSPGYAGLDYAPRLIDKRLYDQIPSTDIRKTMYQDAAGSITPNIPADQSATTWRLPYANLKFGFQQGFVQDYVYMRVSEMVLIEAEALARQAGKSGEAAVALKKLMQNRDDSWNKTSVTVDDVLLQRRIELWGEGFAYFDLKRLNKGIDRTYPESNHEAGAKIMVSANDIRWYYQIPQNALDQYSDLGDNSKLPTILTPTTSSITGTTMSYEATVQNIDLTIPRTFGIKYTKDPTFTNNVVSIATSEFSDMKIKQTITSLEPQTTYYGKVYYSSTHGTSLSPMFTFTTTALQLPTVSHSVVSIGETSIGVTGSFQFHEQIIEKGFELAIDSLFTTGKISQAIEGELTHTYSNLSKGTLYYIRAYVRVKDGIVYSSTTQTTTLGTIDIKNVPYSILGTEEISKWQQTEFTFVDGDGDGINWSIQQFNANNIMQVGLISYSWHNTPLQPENYVVLPPILLGSSSATISIDVKAFDNTYYREKFKVIISETAINNTEKARNAHVLSESTLSSANLTTHSITIPPSYHGKVVWIGIAHFDTIDEYAIGITNIRVQ